MWSRIYSSGTTAAGASYNALSELMLLDCLTGSIYQDPPLQALGKNNFDPTLREYGWDWPSFAHSMIGRKRIGNLR